MTTYALNNLWSYLQGLTLGRSDREWLASKLLESTKEEQTSVKTSEKSYKVMPISPDIKKWSGCASFTEEEIDNDPRLKAILSRWNAYFPAPKEQLQKALGQRMHDFEDMLQYQCAKAGKCDVIITNNKNDFAEFCELPFMTAAEFLAGENNA